MDDFARLFVFYGEYYWKGYGSELEGEDKTFFIAELEKMYKEGIKEWESIDGSQKIYNALILAKAYREGYGVAKDETIAESLEWFHKMDQKGKALENN